MKKYIGKVLLLTIFMLLLIAIPVFAQTYSYRAPYTVTDGTAYDMLGVTEDANVEWMADNGFMTQSTMDTRIETLGGLYKPWMVADDRINTAIPVPADSQTNLFFTTGNSLASSMDIIPASEGFVTMSDDDILEITDTFELTFDDMFVASSLSQTFVSKSGAVSFGQSGGTVQGAIPGTDEVQLTVATFAAWHVYDMSAYVPSSATGVVLHYNGVAKDVQFRETGSADNRIYYGQNGWGMVGLDANTTFELYVEDNTVTLYVVGWTNDNWVFFETDPDVSSPGGVWPDTDVSAHCPAGTEAVILDVVNTGIASWTSAVRMNGSADNRPQDILNGSHLYMIIGVDAARIFEQQIQNVAVDTYLVGYVSDADATFELNATDYSLVGLAAWTDIDLTPSIAAGATFAFMEVTANPGGAWTYGLRLEGSVINEQGITQGQSIAVVRMDAGDEIEGIISNANIDMWYQGCVEDSIQLPFDLSVSAPVADGEHDVILRATGGAGDLELEIDTVIEDTIAMGGASVPLNAADWILFDGCPYVGSYIHEVAGVIQAWFQPNYMVENTGLEGTETAGGSKVTLTAAEITEGVDYWVGARVIITSAGGVAPEDETSIVTASAVGSVTISPALTVNIDIGDKFTLDFGTLIDRSIYGLDFDGAGDEVVVTDAAAIQNIFDGGGAISLWTDCTSDGENNEGRLADKLQWHVRVDNEAAGEVCLTFFVNFNGITDGEWTTTATEIVIGDWTNIVITYDADAVANNPIFYINGTALTVGAGLTETTAPVGARVTDVGDDLYFGDNAAGLRCYDGVIDEVWLFDDILTQANVTADYNSGDGSYVQNDSTDLVAEYHAELGTGAVLTDSSGNANNGAITNASWVDGFVERTAGLAGTFDARITWGVNPSAITVALGSFVSSSTPVPGVSGVAPTVDYLPSTGGSDLNIDPDLVTLATHPLRPFVTIMSDTTTITELQAWRFFGFIFVLVFFGIAIGNTRNITIISLVTGGGVMVVVGQSIWPWYALLLLGVGVLAIIIDHRRHTI